MTNLCFVSKTEFQRLNELKFSLEAPANLFATYCRINTLYMITLTGSGHIGSSFSSMDIVSWLFLNKLRLSGGGLEIRNQDVYFSSKGHDVPALYSVLIGLGLLEFDLIHKLRRINGLPGHPDISIPFIAANTGSLGMGISKAKGMILSHRLQGNGDHVFVMTGDGELQEGQIWESLQSAANMKMHEITVIVDHNKIQSDTWLASTSDLGDIEGKFKVFGWHVERCDGHNMKEIAEVFAKLSTITDKPKVIIADTIKGKGVSFMEGTALKSCNELYRFHSGAPDYETYAAALAELTNLANNHLRMAGVSELRLESIPKTALPQIKNPQRLITAYSNVLVNLAELNPKIVVLDADLKVDCGLIPFQKRFPNRFFECGIAEQDMVSQAGGMALRGLLPIVHSFACFLSTRPNEQIYNNATEKTKIIYVGALAGLLPGGPGHSHQSVRDIAALSAIPNLIMFEPCNEKEVVLALDFCINKTLASCYLRLVSIPCQIPYELPEDYHIQYGKGAAIMEGRDAILFAYGPVMLSEAFKASKILREIHGIEVKVVNLPWLNYVDTDWLIESVKNYQCICIVDNHYVVGGQGEMIVSRLRQADNTNHARIIRFGVKDIPVCGSNEEVLQAHNLDAASLSREIANFFHGVSS